ncbi:Hsp20/alpha crystallin family protein [Candidatus Peregrinibacteria bacterium]|nr:Hsp20/alpha crystallin family protein [Candidatus Peregrinibacteria bacterium]
MQIIPRKQQRQTGSGQQALTLRDAMNQLFDESFWDPMRFFSECSLLPVASQQWQFLPSFDIAETDKELQVVADVPGYDSNDVSVNLENGVLTIEGKMEEQNEEKDKRWYRREASHGSFRQQVSLPQGIDVKNVKCKMKNGKLTITVPKTQESKPQGRTLAIETE